MRYIISLIAGATLLCQSVNAQELPVQNSYKIEGDSKELIIKKAARVVPSPRQLKGLENEFIAFVHFGPNTFTRMEWGNGKEDPKIFDLKELDTDQWCQAMKAAGMKMVVLTVKHHDGFVLWQSRYTDHGIMSSNFRDGKGDILKDLSQSCQKYGIKLGVYLSPADLYQVENEKGLYGNLSKYTKRTIPRAVEGRPFKNKTTFEVVTDDYNEYFMNQLFEILSEYGPIHEVWFDGANPKQKGGQKYNYHDWEKIIRALAPEAVIFGRKDIRWCGNEGGQTRKTEWNVIPYLDNPDNITRYPDLMAENLACREKLYEGKYLQYQQAETNTSIREGWFYRDDTHQKVRSADDVFDIYERSVGGNSTLLLNIPPNRDGKFSDTDVEVLAEVGQRIKETYGVNLLKGAKGAMQLLDNSTKTFINVAPQSNFVVTTPKPVTINRLLLQEAISTNGERVEKHAVDAWINGQWTEIASATNIGYKRILRFPTVTTNKIRVRILEARDIPAIANVSAHYYELRPPQLSFTRDINGMVSIQPKGDEFGWNKHSQEPSDDASKGVKIFYTIDGSTPTTSSKEYKEPFVMGAGEVKALAVIGKKKGAVDSRRFGIIKSSWKITNVSSQQKDHEALKAFDESPRTYWLSNPDAQATIEIDLGSQQNIAGIAYTPQQKNGEGMMSKGIIKVSDDGINWRKIDTFEFGNLVNDPTQRYHYLKTPTKARYISITTPQQTSIAELDILA